MHNKYAKDGLAAISVSIDEMPTEEATKAKVLKFLQSKNATFTNLILDEPIQVWDEKLHFQNPPCVFVFNREGKWTQFKAGGDKEVDNDAIEKLVVELLKKK